MNTGIHLSLLVRTCIPKFSVTGFTGLHVGMSQSA